MFNHIEEIICDLGKYFTPNLNGHDCWIYYPLDEINKGGFKLSYVGMDIKSTNNIPYTIGISLRLTMRGVMDPSIDILEEYIPVNESPTNRIILISDNDLIGVYRDTFMYSIYMICDICVDIQYEPSSNKDINLGDFHYKTSSRNHFLNCENSIGYFNHIAKMKGHCGICELIIHFIFYDINDWFSIITLKGYFKFGLKPNI
jgi:hypothetical protein